jgi:hypothetical protein
MPNKDMKFLDPCARASVRKNEDFFWVYTQSGRGLVAYDPQGKDVILGCDADDNALGVALREALASSRLLSPEEAMKFLDYRTSGTEYEERLKSLREMHRYQNQSVMFANMRCCNITLSQGTIEIRPMVHEAFDGWGRTKNDGIENVLIPSNSDFHEIGSALRLAFSRCLEKPGLLTGETPDSLPSNFETFAFINPATRNATSARTLYTLAPSMLTNPAQLYQQLVEYVDAAVEFSEGGSRYMVITASEINLRIIQVAIPPGTTAEQMQQLDEAVRYGRRRGIIVIIRKAK